MSVLRLFLFCVVSIASSARAQVPESVAMLLPAQLVTEPGFFQGTTEITIVNRSAAAITAWAIRLHCAGDRPRSRGHSTDASISLERVRAFGPQRSLDGFIDPGGTLTDRELACGPNGRGELPEAITLDWVIFDDGTWAGDPEGVRDAFAARRAHREDWATTLAVMEEVGATRSGREALLTAKDRLTPLSTPDRPNSATDTLRNIGFALDARRANQPSSEDWWSKLVDEARFQVAAADRHISPAATQPLSPPVVQR